MKKAFLLIFLLVLGLAGAGYGGYLWWKQTPEASLHRLEVSFEEHDYESFCRYVDVEALAGQFTDNLITVVVQSAKDSFTRDDSYNERVQTLEKRFVPRFRSEGKGLFRKAFGFGNLIGSWSNLMKEGYHCCPPLLFKLTGKAGYPHITGKSSPRS